MKTAMQELLSEISHPNWDKLSFDARYEMFDKLLDLEKEQIKNAYIIGFSDCHSSSAKDQDLYFNIMYNGKDL